MAQNEMWGRKRPLWRALFSVVSLLWFWVLSTCTSRWPAKLALSAQKQLLLEVWKQQDLPTVAKGHLERTLPVRSVR
jgi:hypothetical protein